MARLLAALTFCALAGCTALPRTAPEPSACAQGEATYACQVERYQNVNVN